MSVVAVQKKERLKLGLVALLEVPSRFELL